eukprot:5489812-Prymnesium_polylepis.2
MLTVQVKVSVGRLRVVEGEGSRVAGPGGASPAAAAPGRAPRRAHAAPPAPRCSCRPRPSLRASPAWQQRHDHTLRAAPQAATTEQGNATAATAQGGVLTWISATSAATSASTEVPSQKSRKRTSAAVACCVSAALRA